MPKWKFWERGKDKASDKEVTTLKRLEREGLLRVFTTDVLENRMKKLRNGLHQNLEVFREAQTETLDKDMIQLLPEEDRLEAIKQRQKAITTQREALDNIVVLLTDAAWPWNRAGENSRSLMRFLTDEFLQDYEEFKHLPAYYDDLYTMALSLVQKSFYDQDVTKEVPIALFSPAPNQDTRMRMSDEQEL